MPQEYEYFDGIPVFHELIDVDKQGNVIDYNPSKLAQIVQVNNDRIDQGEPPSLIIGHNQGEEERPAIGFIDRFSLGLRNGLATIFSRWRVYKDQVSLLKSYPKRSVEIHTDDNLIPALALLGSNPALELGTFQYSDKKIKATFLNKFDDESPEPTGELMADNVPNTPVSDELKNAIIEVLSQTDVFAFVKELMNQESQNADEAPEVADMNSVAKDDEGDEEQQKSADEPEKVEDKDSEDESPEDKKPEEDDKQNKSKFSKLEQKARHLEAQVRAMTREKTLMGLQGEGFDIDVDSEIKESAKDSDELFDKRVSLIKKYSKRAPVNVNFDLSRIDNNVSKGGLLPPSELDEVSKLALKQGVPFGQAFREYTNKK